MAAARRGSGDWLTLDTAIARHVLVVTEKGGGSVPIVVVENRSRREHVFLMAGEIDSALGDLRAIRPDEIPLRDRERRIHLLYALQN